MRVLAGYALMGLTVVALASAGATWWVALITLAAYNLIINVANGRGSRIV